jgi:hypothetical protein
MIHGARFYAVVVAAVAFFPTAQLRAEEKEPFAVIELGAAAERSIQDGVYSAGPSASVEFPVIKDGWKSRRVSHHCSGRARQNGKLIFSSRNRSRSTSTSSSWSGQVRS